MHTKEKGADNGLEIQPLILPCFPDSGVVGLFNAGRKKTEMGWIIVVSLVPTLPFHCLSIVSSPV